MNNAPASPKPSEGQTPFYPNLLFVEAVTALVVTAALVVVTLLWDVPLEEMAHPSDTTYIPRPEWYFLFYFQLLKYFEGSLTVVGVFILPLLFFGALFFLPFFDRSKTTTIKKRPVAAVSALASIILVVGMTVQSIAHDATSERIRWIYLPPVTDEQVAAGQETFNRFCMLCHAMDGKGGFMATDLTQIGGRASRTYIENVIINPQIVSQKTIMSLIPLSEEERHEVSAYLLQKK